jgi:hypothetical protein
MSEARSSIKTLMQQTRERARKKQRERERSGRENRRTGKESMERNWKRVKKERNQGQKRPI